MPMQAFQKRFMKANGDTGWMLVRSIVAIVLLVAATLKAHQLATTPSLEEGLLHARWFQIVLVECELALAVVLLVGIVPRVAWLVTTLLFLVFGMVSLAKGINGSESCGCFGSVTVNPWYTFVMDVGIVASLSAFRPMITVFHWKVFERELCRAWRSKRVIAAVTAYLALAVLATCAMMSVRSKHLAELGREFIGADGRKTILLEPEKWVGKEFPLLPYIGAPEVREKLKTGEWTVVLYHHDCSKCNEVINELIQKKTENLVCVEMNSGNTVFDDKEFSANFMQMRITDKLEWFVVTPITLEIFQNVVSKIY